jgi:hypothetical protein
LHGAEAEIRLAGIPIDREFLLELCKKTDNRGAFLRLRLNKSFDELPLRSDRMTLQPIGLILSTEFTEQKSVSGIIAKNPFFRNPSILGKAGVKAESPLSISAPWKSSAVS